MAHYQLNLPPNKADRDLRMIMERISQLEKVQFTLTGDDYRRFRITLDYNRRLLNGWNATVTLNASR